MTVPDTAPMRRLSPTAEGVTPEAKTPPAKPAAQPFNSPLEKKKPVKTAPEFSLKNLFR